MGPLVVKSPNYLNNCLCMYEYIYICIHVQMDICSMYIRDILQGISLPCW